MKNKILIALIAVLIIGTTGCRKLYEMDQPKEKAVEYSVIWPLAGEWWVTYKFDDGSGVVDDWYAVGHTKLYTYNTAAEDVNKFWINDLGNFWNFTVKADCDVASATFSGTNLVDNVAGHDVKCTIKNGKVIKGGGISPNKVVTDSIYFEIQFSDDTDNFTYQCSGVRRTGFQEDDY